MRFLIIAVFTITTFATCIDPFDPGIDGEGRKLVVDGLITNLPDPYTVRLTYSEPYNNDSITLPVTNATVYIKDDLGNQFNLTYTTRGNYVTNPEHFQGEIGRIYTLHIRTPDGKNYESKPQQMLLPPPIDTVFTRYVEKTDSRGVTENYFEAYARTTDPADQDNFYQWRWAHYEQLEYCEESYDGRFRALRVYECCGRVPCWTITRCQGNDCILIGDDLYRNGNILEQYIAKIAYESKEDYFLVVDQLALPEENYRFWETVNRQLNNTGGIFDAPPSATISNIFNITDPEEQVLGIFSVAGGSRYSAYLSRNFIPQLPDPPPVKPPIIFENSCRSCEESAVRTGKKPPGW